MNPVPSPTEARSPAGFAVDLEALTGGMVHSLRNPLSAILTAATLVRDDPGIDDESRMLVDVISKEARRLDATLTRISDYVKMPPPRPQVIQLATALREALARLRRDRLVPPEVKVDDTLPDQLPVWADPQHLEAALRQILLNACQAMPEGGPLRLSGSCDGRLSSLLVQDSGPGFCGESLARGITPFFTTRPEATGLGLTVVQAVAEAARGRLVLSNRDAETGACVRLDLPAKYRRS